MDEGSDEDSLDAFLHFTDSQGLARNPIQAQEQTVMEEHPPTSRVLYEFPVQIVVKNYKGQQQRTSTLLPVFQFQCQNVDDFKRKLWDTFHDYIKGTAVIPTDESIVYSTSTDLPDIRDAHKYFQFEHGRKSITFESDGVSRGRISLSTLQTWSRKADVVEGTLYTYSVSIQTQKMWEKFNREVLQPHQTDRSGAPSQLHIDEIAREIKERFRAINLH
jgi:hypothetical protein